MKELIKHLLNCNREEILHRSILHCHSPFLHSIMFLECPGKTIRLFIAEPGHKLAQNRADRFTSEQSLGFHSHHCELTFIPTRGQIGNWEVAPSKANGYLCGEFKYQSAIKTGTAHFEKLGEQMFCTREYFLMKAGITDSFYMPASAIHTVIVNEGEWAAWLVLEGRETEDPDNRCWSCSDLTKEDFSGLYQPMNELELERLIEESHILKP